MDRGDAIALALVDALQAHGLAGWGYSGPFEIAYQSRARFDLLTATEKLQIRVTAFEESNVVHQFRKSVIEDHRIGIALVKLMGHAPGGEIDETEFKLLKSVAKEIKEWGWKALSKPVAIKSELPAKFDSEKATSTTFLTVVTITYRLGYEI